jgi:hypothetical protein
MVLLVVYRYTLREPVVLALLVLVRWRRGDTVPTTWRRAV